MQKRHETNHFKIINERILIKNEKILILPQSLLIKGDTINN